MPQRTSVSCGDGAQRDVSTFRVSSPIGEMSIEVCPRGLHKVNQSQGISDENFSPDLSVSVKLIGEIPSDPDVQKHLQESLTWLELYFKDGNSCSNLQFPSFCLISSDALKFREKVWLCLAKQVPFGKVITYGELATLSGSPGAQQAAGTAMASNPFQLMVPCHRVVKSGQHVGKYSRGCRNLVKIWLLRHEGFNISEDGTVSKESDKK